MQKFPFAPTGLVPNSRQLEWWSRARTAFFHFGINTFTGLEWGEGTEDPAMFDPTELDCRQWIRTIRDAGFSAAILTAKHHDGFCLWPSAYTEHSVKNSPYKNGQGDIVREFCNACHELGIKPGLYLSPWDRHEPTWGSEEYNDFYVNQLTELLSNYGTLYEIWWDGAGSTKSHYDWERWVKTVRTFQPNAAIFGSLGASPFVDIRWVGNEIGYAGLPCWATVDEIALREERCDMLNSGKLDGDRYIPAEVDVSIRPGWFYHPEQDGFVRSPRNLTDLWLHSCGRNAGWLMNLPPDRRGLIADPDVRSLHSFAKTLEKNLSKNLAKGAAVTATSIRADGYAPLDILEGSGGYYAPKDGDLTPSVTIALPTPAKINMIAFAEAVELGHRVTAYTVEAEIGGEWKVLFTGECVGHYCARKIDPVTASALRLSVTDALAEPVLCNLGAYLFEEAEDFPTAHVQNIADWSARMTSTDDSVTIRLGGIFPFDTLKLNGNGIRAFEIDIFNGTDFEFFAHVDHSGEGECIYRFPRRIDWSYQLRIRVTEGNGHPLQGGSRPKLF